MRLLYDGCLHVVKLLPDESSCGLRDAGGDGCQSCCGRDGEQDLFDGHAGVADLDLVASRSLSHWCGCVGFLVSVWAHVPYPGEVGRVTEPPEQDRTPPTGDHQINSSDYIHEFRLVGAKCRMMFVFDE